MRTHTCGILTKKEVKKKVKLCGWVSTARDHGGVIFIDLRDRYGITQIVFDPSHNKEVHPIGEALKRESVIQIEGIVKERKKGMQNKNILTGDIEVFVDRINVLSESDVPPIEIDDRKVAGDDLRLEYRYLDLRRPSMQKQLKTRHEAAQSAREFLNKNNFLEMETPMLLRSTPEGARDYVVPSRVHPGRFYALPQSPQIYKQILMISGFDRYYQFARCLRDEDLRQDRQPEHTQIDLEMSFVEQGDVMFIMEGMVKHVLKKVLNKDIKEKFPVLTFKDVMEKYGTDQPDLRFGLELKDVTSIVKNSKFAVFNDVISKKGIVKLINPKKDLSRNEIDKYIDFCIKEGAKGMAWMKYDGKKFESNIVKFFPENVLNELKKVAKKGMIFFIADKEDKVNEIMSKLRLKLGEDLKLIKDDFKFCWVIDYPLFEFDKELNSWQPMHHMFTMPKKECIELLEKDPGNVIASLYDLVLNGIELGSGSIRVNEPNLQKRIMKVIGLDEKEAEKKFGFLLKAYKYGGPPHGGIGFGFDRFVALLCGHNDIREVIAFPKNKAAQCPMDGSPAEIDNSQLKELNIKI